MHGQRQAFSVQVLKINYLKTSFIFFLLLLLPRLAGFGDGGSFFSVLWPVAPWQVSHSSGASGVTTDLTPAPEIWWVHFTVPILSVHLGPCPSALGATLISLPIFSCLRNGSFKHCHQLANSYISHSLLLPTSGRTWLYTQLPGQVDFDTFEQWFSWQWPSPPILKKLNCFWKGDPAVSQ